MLPNTERIGNKTEKINQKVSAKEEKKIPFQRVRLRMFIFMQINYQCEMIVGQGAFGIVYKARCLDTEEIFAVKKVLQDKTFKSRELELLQSFTHPNIMNLRDHFIEKSEES